MTHSLSSSIGLGSLGFVDSHLDLMREMRACPSGLVLVTGTTNAGKATTVKRWKDEWPGARLLSELRDPEWGDTLSGIALHAEIRTPECVVEAQRAVGRGEIVIATLHCSRAIQAFDRIHRLGGADEVVRDPGFLACVVNQSLIPNVCPGCGRRKSRNKEKEARYQRAFAGTARHVNPKGCGKCVGGSTRRRLVGEVLPIWLDRGGRSPKLVRKGRFKALERRLLKAFDAPSKLENARDLVAVGELSPFHAEWALDTRFDGPGARGTLVA